MGEGWLGIPLSWALVGSVLLAASRSCNLEGKVSLDEMWKVEGRENDPLLGSVCSL